MKKYLILVAFLSLVVLISGNSLAASDNLNDHEMMVGLGFPTVGWAQYNEAQELTGYKGINIGLGYSSKNYMEPGLKEGEFNTYWGWGTVALIWPYGELGVDYPFAVSENGNFWTAGGSITVLAPLIPSPTVNFSYHF